MAKARYRAARPAAAPPPAKPRWIKRVVLVGLLVGYAALMWYVVFPYVDRTFVNQPAVGDDLFSTPVPTITRTGEASPQPAE